MWLISRVSGGCMCSCLHPRLVKQFSSFPPRFLMSFRLTRQNQQQQPEHKQDCSRVWRRSACRLQGLEKSKVKLSVKCFTSFLLRKKNSINERKSTLLNHWKLICRSYQRTDWMEENFFPSCLTRKKSHPLKTQQGKARKNSYCFSGYCAIAQ